ncbi:putative lipoprotein YehR precursor [Planococcus massiliensis]|uniref:Putative lipoprotein YehR n=1 Tax=Planococcus massiliensis TaxID=1499687 RepID=A0A098EI40_9BACL|nr:YehR family protein [Planococcus massiliensis]CEG21462.1 putative lipoprotein YehR precursor [Planococcus massiliensis]
MKKFKGAIGLLALTLFLAACGGEEASTRTFEMENNGIVTTMVYTTEGDKVTKQSTENLIQYDLAGIESKDQARELFDPLIGEFQGIEGITHQMEYEEDQAVETMEIDYETVDFDEIENLPGMSFSDDPKDNGVSMEKSLEILESQGFKEVE